MSPSESVAATVKLAVAFSATLPRLPAEVVHVGVLSTLITLSKVAVAPVAEMYLTS